MNVCSLCMVLKCDENLHLGQSWLQNTPRFTAFAFQVNAKDVVITTIPGEALTELGYQIRNDTKDLGFDVTFLAGYSKPTAWCAWFYELKSVLL